MAMTVLVAGERGDKRISECAAADIQVDGSLEKGRPMHVAMGTVPA